MDAPGPSKTTITPERRALLARKGEILYAKYCGTKGRGICAENFAMFQLRLGNEEVVVDFLRFLVMLTSEGGEEYYKKLDQLNPAESAALMLQCFHKGREGPLDALHYLKTLRKVHPDD